MPAKAEGLMGVIVSREGPNGISDREVGILGNTLDGER